VARNRKRRSPGRTRRPGEGAGTRPGVATASNDRADGAPSPLEHAAPDVELAEEQLMVGRPEVSEAEMAENEQEPDDGGYDEGEEDADVSDGETRGHRPASTAMSVRAPGPGARLVEFLRGSWRELQRVQWPDRRQVMQATGVVIGFVIVAGVFLGVADLVAAKIVKLILP
jgi:preprotein translocase subunit SecE